MPPKKAEFARRSVALARAGSIWMILLISPVELDSLCRAC